MTEFRETERSYEAHLAQQRRQFAERRVRSSTLKETVWLLVIIAAASLLWRLL